VKACVSGMRETSLYYQHLFWFQKTEVHSLVLLPRELLLLTLSFFDLRGICQKARIEKYMQGVSETATLRLTSILVDAWDHGPRNEVLLRVASERCPNLRIIRGDLHQDQDTFGATYEVFLQVYLLSFHYVDEGVLNHCLVPVVFSITNTTTHHHHRRRHHKYHHHHASGNHHPSSNHLFRVYPGVSDLGRACPPQSREIDGFLGIQFFLPLAHTSIFTFGPVNPNATRSH